MENTSFLGGDALFFRQIIAIVTFLRVGGLCENSNHKEKWLQKHRPVWI